MICIHEVIYNPFHYYPDFLTSSTLELRRYENERHYKHDY